MKKKCIIVVLVLLLVIITFTGCIKEEGENQNIYNSDPIDVEDISENGAFRPSIYGNYIIWVQKEDEEYNIHLYNLNTKEEQILTNNKSRQDNPDIYKNYIVWENIKEYEEDEFEDNSKIQLIDIILYDINTKQEMKISKVNCTNRDPKVYDNRVIWVEIEYDYEFPISINWIRIAIYDIGSGTISYIASNFTNHYQYDLIPDIYQNYIVWTDMRNGDGYNTDNPNYDIFLYNCLDKTEKQISTKTYYEGAPKIFGDHIYWQEYRNEGKIEGNMFVYDLKTKDVEKLFYHDNFAVYYEVTSQYVVWCNGDIQLFDLSTKEMKTISTDPNDGYVHSQGIQDIYENEIVWEYSIYEETMDYPETIKESNIQYGEISV